MTTFGLHVFCSVKGGVGKSTLAVATAKLLAARGRRPVIVDADMLGASLADGLRLRAPVVSTIEGGAIDLEGAATGDWYSVAQTRLMRDQRGLWLERHAIQDSSGPIPQAPPPPFLNDALSYAVPDSHRECNVASLIWRHEFDDGVWYLPSSPLRVDAARAAPYAVGQVGEFQWVRRLAWVLDGLLDQRPELTDVVLDLPPGTWGFAHEIMVLTGTLGSGGSLPEGYPPWGTKRTWRVNPFIVTSRDRNDRVLALDYFLYARGLVPQLRPLCNRLHEGLGELRRQVKADLPRAVRSLGIEREILSVPELPRSLGRAFVDGDVKLEEVGTLLATLRLDAFENEKAEPV